jgi:hypothetical protein
MPDTSRPFDWVNESGTRRFVRGDGVPEGIFYPERPGMTDQEWRAEALAAGRALWRAIENRRVWLVGRYSTRVLHALRTEPRGYGSRRREWERVSECGQFFLEGEKLPGGQGDTPIGQTACLACRKVIRERLELVIRFGDFDAQEAEDALVEHEREQMWRVQAEWHKPDPIPMWNVPETLTYSLAGG